jgi:hypothetical protein
MGTFVALFEHPPVHTVQQCPTCLSFIPVRLALGAPGVIRTHAPLLRRYFALSAVLP